MAENSSARVVALDNLRVVAMLLGLVTHGVLPYTASGLAGFPVRDTGRSLLADAVYFGIHDFRMQLFFLLAGFASAALAARRGVGAFARNRLLRIVLPLAVAVLTVGPLMHLMFAWHAADRGQSWDVAHAGGWVGPNFHLWFLYYLLLVCLPLAAVLAGRRFIPRGVVAAFDSAVRAVAGSWWKLPLLALLTVPILWDMKAWLVDTPTTWLPDPAVYLYYLGFYLTGAVLFRHRDLLPSVGKRWAWRLGLANAVILPLMLWMTITGNWWELELAGETPLPFVGWKAAAVTLDALYTWLCVAGLIGLFQRFFATQSGWWKYMVGASYWCYLAGFPIQAGLQVWFARVGLPAFTEFLLVNTLTFVLLLGTYELLVRRSWVGWVLNGTRPEPKPFQPRTVVAARVSVASAGPQPVAVPKWGSAVRPTADTGNRGESGRPRLGSSERAAGGRPRGDSP
jgi:glucan biosynthesis protein C